MKKVLSLALVLLLSVFLVACGGSSSGDGVVYNEEQAAESIMKIENASEIKVCESELSIGKKYTIYADDEKVGIIEGEFLKIGGDTFTFTDIYGNRLYYEKEVKRWGRLNRSAVVYDNNDNLLGYIGERTDTKLFTIGHFFHIYDESQNEIGVSDEENFSFTKETNMYNIDESIAFTSSKKFMSLQDEYTISVIDNSSVPSYMAIFTTCVIDAISDSDD